jgi:DNA-directed RNA polymerase subunit L
MQYEHWLKTFGSLSKLFSESEKPYLEYRLVENLFCNIFGAKNVSRSDLAIDAIYENSSTGLLGINIKTFVYRPIAREKIAEFNAHHAQFTELLDKERIIRIAQLRNQRLQFVQENYQLSKLLYHCVVRNQNQIEINEYQINFIQTDNITVTEQTESSINFTDSHQSYSFVNAKSTLYTYFDCQKPLHRFNVQIVDNPFAEFEKHFGQQPLLQKIFLPLYSTRSHIKEVPVRSGLNQWNASGRERHYDEAYIPIPLWIHRVFKNFFPPIDKPFTLHLPDNRSILVKVCQDGGKALMSNPNKLLGEWLLRGFMKISYGQLVTYDLLKAVGVDSVIIEKYDDETFGIDFAPIDAYENFEEEHKK